MEHVQRQVVDEAITAAPGAGATVSGPSAPTFHGAGAGCFADPEGHVRDIAPNPGFTIADDGSLVRPDFGAAT